MSARGNGRGRGRGGRGRGGRRGGRGGPRGDAAGANWGCLACRFENSDFLPYCEACGVKKGENVSLAPSQVDGGASTAKGGLPSDFFQATSTFGPHVAALRANRAEYFIDLTSSVYSGISMNPAVRARVLAAAWATGEKAAVDDLLAMPEVIGVNEVLKALQILDAPRASRKLADKIERVRATATPTTIARLQTDLQNLRAEMLMGERVGSVTRSLCKRIAVWASRIPAESLEFYLLNFPTAPWKAVADLCHLKPADFQLPYFLSAVFDDSAVPADSLVGRGRALTSDNLAAMLAAEPRFLNMYSFLRKRVEPASYSEAAKVAMTSGAPLGEVIWWFHELECDAACAVLGKRLESGESVDSMRYSLNFGKLMERLLTFTERGWPFAAHLLPIAEARLASVVFPPNDVRVAVLGDASGSMEVAVKTASILGGLLSACLSAELVFFNHLPLWPPVQPRTAAQVVDVARVVQADGGTAPVVALLEYARSFRVIIDVFIVVTDEEENESVYVPELHYLRHGSVRFAELFQYYKLCINPNARVVFCSFLPPNVRVGRMQREMADLGLPCDVFPLNPRCPDLAKFDSLLQLLKRVNEQLVLAKGASCSGAVGSSGTSVPASDSHVAATLDTVDSACVASDAAAPVTVTAARPNLKRIHSACSDDVVVVAATSVTPITTSIADLRVHAPAQDAAACMGSSTPQSMGTEEEAMDECQDVVGKRRRAGPE